MKSEIPMFIKISALLVPSALFIFSLPVFAQNLDGIEDIFLDGRGSGFREVDTQVTWLDVPNFKGQSYEQIEDSLVGTGFRIAVKSEVQRLVDLVGGYHIAFGLPSPLSYYGGYVRGYYDDSKTGSNPDKVGDGNAFYFPVGQVPGFTLTDDEFDKSFSASTFGAWVVQQTAVSCSLDPGRIDFDCDGVTDKVVWREDTGTWYVKFSSTGELMVIQWGLPGDVPVIGDYDGDGIPDFAVWRPSNGVWYIKQSKNQYSAVKSIALQFGLTGDRPLRNDFDGDGRMDVGVWRPSNGNYYYVRSTDAQIIVEQWGLPGDIPMNAVFSTTSK